MQSCSIRAARRDTTKGMWCYNGVERSARRPCPCPPSTVVYLGKGARQSLVNENLSKRDAISWSHSSCRLDVDGLLLRYSETSFSRYAARMVGCTYHIEQLRQALRLHRKTHRGDGVWWPMLLRRQTCQQRSRPWQVQLSLRRKFQRAVRWQRDLEHFQENRGLQGEAWTSSSSRGPWHCGCILSMQSAQPLRVHSGHTRDWCSDVYKVAFRRA